MCEFVDHRKPRCVGPDGNPLPDGIDTLLRWADENEFLPQTPRFESSDRRG